MVIFQKYIFRSDLRSNPTVLYLFGDNLERRGLGGQAKEMRGEPNAIGVATKHSPGMFPTDFFDDEFWGQNVESFRLDLKPARHHLKHGGTVIIPADGLGTGLSELPARAPVTNRHLIEMLAGLENVQPYTFGFDGGMAR